MTNMRNRLENILTETALISERLVESGNYPPCCLTINENGEMSCDTLGPLPEKEFLKQCKKCRLRIQKFLTNFNLVVENEI